MINRYPNYFLFLLLLASFNLFAIRPPLDSNYVKDLSDSLVVRVLAVTKKSSVVVRDNKADRKVIYSPLSSIGLGVGITYKWLGVNLVFKIPNSEFSSDNHETKGIDLRVHSFGRLFGFDATLSHFKGFEVNGEVISAMNTDDTFRSDLTSTTLSFSGYFNLNASKFSLRAVTLQNERQLKSAGAPILGGYANVIGLKASDSLFVLAEYLRLNPDPNKNFDKELHFQNLRAFNIGLNGGYVHSFVFKKSFFFTLGANLGLGYDFSVYQYSEEYSKNVTRPELFLVARGAIGYNDDKYYLGLSGYFDRNVVRLKNTQVNFHQMELRLVFAIRFSGDYSRLNKLYRTKAAQILAPND